MKSYKQKYEELLLEKHTRRYIHIPFSWKTIGLFFVLLGSIGLAIANFFLIVSIGHTYKIWELLNSSISEETYSSFSQLIILSPLVGEYFLIGFVTICLAALIKGGFDKLKSFDEEGLIFVLIFGLIAWLVGGLIFVLIGGLITWLISGLIFVLIFGLSKEFEEK